jgi:aminopeptidase 2
VRNTALRCLGRAKDPELIKRTLELLVNGEVKDQDIYMPTGGLRSHPEGINALFAWMKENWDDLVKRFPPALSMLGSLVTIFTSSFTKREQIAEVEKFFEGKSTNGFDQSLAQSLDSIRSKISWVERDKEDVKKWLEENGYFRA